MIDFTNVKNIVIPEGEVSVIARGSEILWQKYVAPSYTELEYIESTGTQWIDTGYSFSPNVEYEFSAMMTQVITNAAFLGQSTIWPWNNSGNSSVAFANASTGKLYGVYSNSGSVGTQTSSTYLNKRFTATFKNLSLSIDGVELQKFSQVTSWANEMPTMHIFNRNTANGSQAINGAYRYYYLKLYDNGILIRDFIPVLDSNGTACMYDKVSGEFFYNKGTGEFAYGEIPTTRLPAEYQEVEYIQLDGKQYIDTGYKGNTTKTRYETKIVPHDVTTTQGVFGSRNTFNISNTDNCLVFFIGGNLRLDWLNGNGANPVNVSATANTVYEINITRGTTFVNGTKYTFNEHTSHNQNNNFLIGNFTNASSAVYATGFIGKIFYSKLYENEVLIRDFVPCYRKSDNKPGMYDLVTETFFTNKGTGEFSYSELNE